MDQDMSLNVEITADSAQAQGQIDTLNARLDAMQTMFEKSASSATGAAGGVTKVGEASSVTSKVLADMSTAGGSAARMFSAVGASAGEAAGRIEAFTGAVGEMKALAPEILLIVGAFTTLMATFSFFKEGIQGAADMQRSMEQLRGVVEMNGQAWDTTREKLEAFFDTESMASGFTREELAATLQDLTTRLGNVNSAMEAMRITEEIARGTGMSLSEAERTLTELLGGRYMMLEKLDPKIKELIKDHATTRDILIELHQHYRNAIQDSDDLATMADREKVAHEKAAEAIGEMMLPALIDLEKLLIGAWDNTRLFAQDWAVLWEGISMTVHGAVLAMKDDIGGLVKAWLDFETGHLGAVAGDLNTSGDRGRAMMSTGEQIIQSASQALAQRPDAYTAGNNDVYQAIQQHEQELMRNIDALDSMPAAATKGLKGIAAHLKHIAHAAKKAKEAMDAFEQSTYTIQDPLKGKSQKDLLDQVLSNDPTSIYSSETSGSNKNLQHTLEEAQKQWAEYYKSLEENAKQWTDKTASWIDEMFSHGKKGVNMFLKTFQDMLKAIEQALLKSALFEMFMGAQGAKGPSFMSVFAQEMGFGSKSPSGGIGGGQVQANSTGGIIGSLVGTSTATQLASSLPTDSLMSLMFGVGAPSLTGGGSGGGLGGAVQVIAGAGGPGGGTLAGGSTAGGILSSGSNAISSLGSLGGLKSGIGGIGALLGTHLGTFGGGGGYSFFSSSGSLGTLGSGLLGAAGGYLVGSGIQNLVFGGQPLNSGAKIGGAIGGGAGAILGPALDAALGIGTGGIGLILGPLLGAVGGSLLGGLLGNHDNPAAMPDKYNTTQFGQIVADLTGAGGSSYHTTDPTAPSNHNWFGANGSKFFSNIGSLSGGTSGVSWIEQTLAQYAKPGTTQMGSNTPSWLAPLWNQLVSSFGISASGSGQLNFGHDIGQEDVTGALGASGQMTSYTQLGNLLQQFIQNYMTQGNVGISNGNEPGTGGLPPMSPGANGGFGVYSPFAGAYVVGTPGSTPSLVNGAPSFGLNPDPNAPSNGATTQVVATNPPGAFNQLSQYSTGILGSHQYGSQYGPGNTRGSVHVTVNVGGNVTAENDLANTIQQKLIEITTRNLSSNLMTHGGLGL